MKIRDAVPVLANQADPPRIIDRDHRGRAGMAHEVDLIFAAVRISQAFGGHVDHAAPVNSGCSRSS